jgi:ABC-type polysaccharide/polyol phosphate transport system ATPase subunit
VTLIQFDNVTKWFPHTGGRTLLRKHLLRWMTRQRPARFYALRNVSFRVERGESVGVVGSNGAGKSTLLGLAAGLVEPDGGSVGRSGRIATMLELGSGFHPDLSGTENLILNASLVGLTRKQTREVFDSIVDFAGIPEFMNEPIRTWSSGMVMRLAFAVAIHARADMFLIDEVLAVGDTEFQRKCRGALAEFRRRGGSLLFVSHGAAAVIEVCTRAIWLDHGQLMLDGPAAAVLAAYQGKAAAGVAATPGSGHDTTE